MAALTWAYVLDTHFCQAGGRAVGRVCRPRVWGSARHLGYTWFFDVSGASSGVGREPTLGRAKRRVEAAWRRHLAGGRHPAGHPQTTERA
jgi:hypothetical protein